MDVPGRLSRLRLALADTEALLVTSLTNIRYLTGFTGSAGMLFVLPDEAVLLTDGRYGTQATEQLAAASVDAEVVVARAADQAARARQLVATVTGFRSWAWKPPTSAGPGNGPSPRSGSPEWSCCRPSTWSRISVR